MFFFLGFIFSCVLNYLQFFKSVSIMFVIKLTLILTFYAGPNLFFSLVDIYAFNLCFPTHMEFP